MRFCFVSTTRGSHFMTELLAALAAATEAAGHSAELVLDEFPPHEHEHDRDRVYVVVPHEFDAWGLASGAPDAEQRARTIALCTENPGTEWFEATYRLVSGFGAAVSINRSSAAELRRRGVRCEHVQLGYCERWDTWRRELGSGRAIDALYLGAADPRRDPLLAGIGVSLWRRECQFLVPPLEPRTAPRADFLREQDKYRRLADARILLNLHRTTSAALEWMRFLEAIVNGCVVVSEPSLDGAPLVPGEHYVQAPVERIGDVADALLDDRERLDVLQQRAYDFVREELPIEPAGERLAELANELLAASAGVGTRPGPGSPDAGLDTTGAAAATPPAASTQPDRPTTLDVSAALARVPGSPRRDGTTDSARAHDSARGGWPRRIATGIARPRRRPGDQQPQTPAYRATVPHVSALGVVTAADGQRSLDLLEMLATSARGGLEIVVALGGASGAAERRAARMLERHPTVPILLLDVDASALGAARNALLERARGEHALALPAGGGVFPTTVERLARALDGDDEASFAYAMAAVVEDRVAVELRGSLPWEPRRLTRESWIDSPALIRRERLAELGGYATDVRLTGLEDFDLWCRFADRAERGVHVAQVLAWLAPEDVSGPRDPAALDPSALALLRERCPRLFS